MGDNLRFHDGDATKTTAYVNYSILVDSAVTLVMEGVDASQITDSGRTDQHGGGSYIGTGYFTIIGLTPGLVKYPYTISGAGESYKGCTRTMPADQKTKHSIVLTTCTLYRSNGPTVHRAIRRVVEEYESIAPVCYLHDIDDVMYVDSLQVTSPTVLPASSGVPDITGLASDYAIAWAAWHGHEPTYPTMRKYDFQWVLRNIASGKTGGDHAIEGNHCRGNTSAGNDYDGCDRTLEATAMGVWDAFIGDTNPPMLNTTGWYWGKEIGPVKYSAIDEFYVADPYDGTNANESRTTHPMLGSQQIDDIQTYLDVDTVPFKCMCMSTGFSVAGQPWSEWWYDESTYFHANVLNSTNLNGTDGWFFGLVGDNHTLHAQRLHEGTGTGFWSFCPGTTGSSVPVMGNGNTPVSFGTKTGQTQYFRSASYGTTNDTMQFGAFIHVIVHADETPQRIQVRGIETGGNVVFDYDLDAVSGNDNQFVNRRKMRLAI